MSILVVGSVAFDDVTSPSGSVKNILGGAATYFALAASYFTKVRVVGVVGEDFGPEQERVFQQHSIDVRSRRPLESLQTCIWTRAPAHSKISRRASQTGSQIARSSSPGAGRTSCRRTGPCGAPWKTPT